MNPSVRKEYKWPIPPPSPYLSQIKVTHFLSDVASTLCPNSPLASFLLASRKFLSIFRILVSVESLFLDLVPSLSKLSPFRSAGVGVNISWDIFSIVLRCLQDLLYSVMLSHANTEMTVMQGEVYTHRSWEIGGPPCHAGSRREAPGLVRRQGDEWEHGQTKGRHAEQV